jgi:hypothetical protein
MKITVEPRYFVCIDGYPVGAMHDQFEPSEVPVAFPFRRHQNRFLDEWSDEAFADQMKEHVKAVMALPEKMKRGKSAASWKLE